MLSFLYVYSNHSILECYNLFSGVELSMRSFFVIIISIIMDSEILDQLTILEKNVDWKSPNPREVAK